MKLIKNKLRQIDSKTLLRLLAVVSVAALACLALSQGKVQVPSVNIGLGPSKGANDVSSSLQILALLTVLSIAPAILILTTAFSRIIIIFSFVRSALGTQNIPPNQVIVGLSLFLTFFVMAPTYEKIHSQALQPYLNKKITMDQAFERAQKPLREFMLKNTYEKDLVLFLDIRGEKPKTRDDVSLITLIPAFVISELKTAFIIGFYIFVPFVVVDLIVASALMSMGMMMMPPIVVSLPAKLLVFILADGWSILVSAVLSGYR